MKWLSWKSHVTESLGLDITSTHIGLVHLRKTNTQCQIQQSIHIPIEKDKFSSFEAATIKALKKGAIQLKTHHRKVNIAMPDVATLSRIFTLDTNNADWEKAALLRMAPDIPTPLDQVYLDFEAKKISDHAHPAQVLGVACTQSDLNRRLQMVQSAGLKPEVVELESHAIERALDYFNIIQDSSRQSACIYLTVDTVTILLWVKKTIIAMSSDYLKSVNQSIAIASELQQQLAQILFTSTAKPLQTAYITGDHPLQLGIAGICQRRLGLNVCSFQPKVNTSSKHAITQSLVAVGLALRGPLSIHYKDSL